MRARRDTFLAVVTGIVAVAGGRVVHILLVGIVSYLLGEASRGGAGSLLWILKMFFSPLGWVSYLIWGGLIGLAYAYIHPPNRRVVAIVLCVVFLFVHDALWYHGGNYRLDMKLSRVGRLFSTAFWQEAALPLLLFWFLPHLTSVAFLPAWKHGVETWFAPAQRARR